METNTQVPLYVTLCPKVGLLGFPYISRVFKYKKKVVYHFFSNVLAFRASDWAEKLFASGKNPTPLYQYQLIGNNLPIQ